MRFEQMFKIKSLLGLGAFGVVLEVLNLKSKETSALKIISQKNQQVYQVMRNELVVLQELQHPNIIEFRQILYSSDYVFIEMERMNNGTLEQHIEILKQEQHKTMDEQSVALIMRDIFNGLQMIHEKNFIHRDLKPDNILLNLKQFKELQVNGISPTKTQIKIQYEAKIADFGLSAEHKVNVYSAQENVDEKMGTILYMAPEQAQGQRYGKRIDLWACGIIMYKMLTGEHPFYKQGDDEKAYIKRIASEELTCKTPFSPLAQSLFWRLCSRSLKLNESAPLTQSEEVKLVEADSSLRRAQSALLFLAIQRINEKITQHQKIDISFEYRQKLEMCNNGLYLNDITDLYISPQGSETARGREFSDCDIFNDKSQIRIDEQSFAVSKPSALQIKKQHINLEPKSAFLKDQNKGMKSIDTIQQIMFQTNSNTEDSREMSPLTLQSKQIIRMKITKKSSQPIDSILKAQDSKDFRESPILHNSGSQQLTPQILMAKRSSSSAKGTIDEFQVSRKIKGAQSTNSGKSGHPDSGSNGIIKLKKQDIQTTTKKNPQLGKAYTLNQIPLGQSQGLQLQFQSKSSDTPNAVSSGNQLAPTNIMKMIVQHQESKFKPPISSQHTKHLRSVASVLSDQNVNSNIHSANSCNTEGKAFQSKVQNSQNILSELSTFESTNIQNRQTLTKQLIQEVNQDSLKLQQQRRNKSHSKRISVASSEDFSQTRLNFAQQIAHGSHTTQHKAQNYQSIENQQFQEASGSGSIMSPSQRRLQKPFIIHQKKIIKSNGPNSFPISPSMNGLLSQQLIQQGVHVNTHMYSSQRDLYNPKNQLTQQQTNNLTQLKQNNSKNLQSSAQLNMHKASLAEQLMHQINAMNNPNGQSSGQGNIGGANNFTSSIAYQNHQYGNGSIRSSFGNLNYANQQQQQIQLPTINGKRLQP
eukprot:403333815